MTNPNKPVEPTKGLHKQYNHSADLDLEEETTRILNKLESDYRAKIKKQKELIEAKLAATNYPSELPEFIKKLHICHNLGEAASIEEGETTAILNKLVSNNLAGIWEKLESMEPKWSSSLHWIFFISACESAFFWSDLNSSKQSELDENKDKISETAKTLKRLISGTIHRDEIRVLELFPELCGDLLLEINRENYNCLAIDKLFNLINAPLSDGLDRLVELVMQRCNDGIKRDKGRAHFNHFKKTMLAFFNDEYGKPLYPIVAKLASNILEDGVTYTPEMVSGKA